MRQHDTPDVPDGVRVLTDGGTDVDREHGTKHATVEPVGVTTREVRGEEREVLRVPISSTRPDREGDRFTKEALDAMADQIRDEQPLVFQNHGLAGNWMEAIPYDQAETIGTHFDAEVEAVGDKDADDTEHELFSLINPDGTHPEGERMLKQVRDEKQAIKFSVGFRIHDADPIEDEAGNEIGRAFTNVDLMEDSKVGIPANPDASVTVEAASKGANPVMNHPLMQLFAQQVGVQQSDTPVATKDAATDGGEPEESDDDSDLDAIREAVDANSEAIDSLRSTVEEALESKESCEGDDDCPDGKVCVDGECVDEDEAEESGALPEDVRQRIEDLEAALDDGTGESKTGDPTEADPPIDKTEEPDETSDAEPEGHDTIFD